MTDWQVLASRVPPSAKAIAAARWQQCAMQRRASIIPALRGDRDFARASEAYWIVVEACLTHMEARVLTQKDLVAQASGMASAATISRAIQMLEERGLIRVRVSQADGRVRMIEPTARSLEVFMARVDSAWQAFWSIAETALRSAETADKPSPAE